jgi:hypothetical protein
MKRPGRSVAILGGGPAGATLGTLLARAGLDVVLFARGGRPPIVVGESLVPACVPFLRKLGVEEEVAAYSIWKGGATFVLSRETRLSFRFAEVRGAQTPYSYNVPRDRFDASVLEAARRAGVRVIPETGRLEREGETDQVRLDAESLAKAEDWHGRQPDFIVDAGGRSRTIPRLLGIPVVDGKRRDSALHAHFEGIEVEIPGNVHTDRLEHGWLWRIPLPGRVSMGLVIDSEFIRKFGDCSEEQFDSYLRHDPVIRDYARPARRVTPVVRYTNYQSRAQRGVGSNWALVGDTFGFVDPVFSSGVLIAFQSAERLATALIDGSERTLAFYDKETARNLEAWQRVIGWFYDGRLLTLLKVGAFVRGTMLGKLVDFHFRKHMPRIFTGEDATNRYSLGLIEFMVNHGLARNDPSELRVH